MLLKINEIFHSIQGEGPFTGTPAIFIRMAGCNLKCDFCDTIHEKVNNVMSEEEIVSVVKGHFPKSTNLVVITGGEPFLQDISGLVKILTDNEEYCVQIETNGTVKPIDPDDRIFYDTYVMCSPKPGTKIVISPDYWKYVVRKGDEIIQYDRDRTGHHVYIQPMDEKDPVKNKENTDYAVELCLKYGYRLSLQIHKIVGIP